MWLGTHTECLSFSLQGIEIDIVDKMRLFGVIIDNSFNTHAKEIVRKVSSILQIMIRCKRLIPTYAKKILYIWLIFFHI